MQVGGGGGLVEDTKNNLLQFARTKPMLVGLVLLDHLAKPFDNFAHSFVVISKGDRQTTALTGWGPQ